MNKKNYDEPQSGRYDGCLSTTRGRAGRSKALAGQNDLTHDTDEVTPARELFNVFRYEGTLGGRDITTHNEPLRRGLDDMLLYERDDRSQQRGCSQVRAAHRTCYPPPPTVATATVSTFHMTSRHRERQPRLEHRQPSNMT